MEAKLLPSFWNRSQMSKAPKQSATLATWKSPWSGYPCHLSNVSRSWSLSWRTWQTRKRVQGLHPTSRHLGSREADSCPMRALTLSKLRCCSLTSAGSCSLSPHVWSKSTNPPPTSSMTSRSSKKSFRIKTWTRRKGKTMLIRKTKSTIRTLSLSWWRRWWFRRMMKRMIISSTTTITRIISFWGTQTKHWTKLRRSLSCAATTTKLISSASHSSPSCNSSRPTRCLRSW